MSAAVLRVSHFDLDKIAASGQCFRWEKLYTRKYRITAGDACAYVTQTGDTLTVDDQNVLTSSAEFWANYFAVYDDYAGMWREINRYAAEDGPEAYLTRAARASDGVVILNQPIWETIVSFMVSQNNNIPRIRRSIQTICAECGTLHTSTYDYGNDASPTWEDVTQAVTSGSKFFLSNTTKTADAWGYNFRIKVKRNDATGDCFISSVGGNFE